MKMDLIKDILIYLEENGRPGELIRGLDLEGYSSEEISYHIKLMHECELVEARDSGIDQVFLWYVGDIRCKGHEFLNAIRNESIWNKLKNKLKEEGGAIPFSVLSSLAVKYAEQKYL
ncbi:DUF2513 domain-containing protein [Salipaludibacillus agaradhaerens]|uniref:DUF2513 domain-containing protein n=1 Tax=Salipaludibacillus agaradhaerens TaxID=76935 RepID=UPI001FEA9567|nr:DUF2513 domain-containing protein [Salipaludibacillus agaradhaerens]